MRRLLLASGCFIGSVLLVLVSWHQLASPTTLQLLPAASAPAGSSSAGPGTASPQPTPGIILIQITSPDSLQQESWLHDRPKYMPPDIIECDDPRHRH